MYSDQSLCSLLGADPDRIVQRTLAGDLAHLIWSVAKAMEEDGSCILQGKDTKYGMVTGFDLELTRMLHPNEDLEIPTTRRRERY